MNHKKTLFLALALATATAASGQTNGSNSPYSRYGFGLLADRAQSFNKGMAGTGYGFRSGSEINSKNPAAYSALDSLSFILTPAYRCKPPTSTTAPTPPMLKTRR